MRYFVIAGEASGDLHARHLMSSIARLDGEAEIRYWYRPDLAFMGIVPVLRHLRKILRGERDCKASIEAFRPDRLVLVDYPGFNLRIAGWFKRNCKHFAPALDEMGEVVETDPSYSPEVHYYIAPKLWAWKEYRIREVKRYVDRMLSILPFEVEWFGERHGYRMDYVGNPTAYEVRGYLGSLGTSCKEQDDRVIALLPGSRMQEVVGNLPRMIEALDVVPHEYSFVIAAAPSIERRVYEGIVESIGDATLRERISIAQSSGGDAQSTFRLLMRAEAALVTSGTATLETALIGVPQVVCYWMRWGWLMNILRRILIKTKYVSLVNLICGREVVPELIAGGMKVEDVRRQLKDILPGGKGREAQIQGYAELWKKLGDASAPEKAAEIIASVVVV